MNNSSRYLGALVIAGGVIVTGVQSAAATASRSPHSQAAARAKKTSFGGSVSIGGVLKVSNNASVFGKMYAHNGAEVWNGLLVRSGGVKADSLDITGPLQAASANINGALQASSINGSSLEVSGDGRFNGTLTTGSLSTQGLADSGSLSAGTITTAGSLTAASATLNGLTVNGNVNFSGANVSGLNLSNLSLNGANLQTLSVGAASSGAAPLSVSSNGRTIQLGVNSNGALTADDLALANSLSLGGNLTVKGTGGVTASNLQAPVNGTNQLQPLTLLGSNLGLSGTGLTVSVNQTLANGSDLQLSHSPSQASHIVSAGDADVVGTTTVSVPSGSVAAGGYTAFVSFAKPYQTYPNVTLTAAGDPAPGYTSAPKLWVTVEQGGANQFTGFTVHYVPPVALNASIDRSFSVTYNYHVLAG